MFEVIALSAGRTMAEIQPAYGGRLLSLYELTLDGRLDWLEPAPPAADQNTPHVKAGCFPMVPYCDAIRDGRLEFHGREYDIGRTHPWPDACHGRGFLGAWAIEGLSQGELTISFRYWGEDWPSQYRAVQVFRLGDRRLEIELALENIGRGAMPGGFGLHPYFPSRQDLCFEVWAPQSEHLAAALRPEQKGKPAFDHGQLHSGSHVRGNTAYFLSRWQGYARMNWTSPRRSIEVRATPSLRYCVLFAPPDRDVLCLEPSSHAVGAFNAEGRGQDTGVRILAPGEILRATVAMTCSSD
jgi:aldose 1-epimerase